MSFGGELKGFSKGFSSGIDDYSAIQKMRKERMWREDEVKGGDEFPPAPVPQTSQPDGGKSGGKSGAKLDAASDVRWGQASPEQRALLNTIAGTESPGYNVVYGGDTFEGYGAHPGRDVVITSGPNKGQTSSAAGRYQFLGSTWNNIAKAYHLDDFSPENQDKGAWYLATEAYGRETGRDLNTDIKSKDPATLAGIGKALSGTWTSLPSGIEQGQNSDKFVSSFTNFLGKASGSQSAEADTTGGAAGGTAASSGGGGGALPEEDDTDSDDTEDGGEEESAGLERRSRDLQLETNPVVATNFEAPQVATQFDLDVGGLSPPRDQEARPQMWAARGGVIPEPAQAFADGGGVNPSGDPDKYNATRAYTQAIPQAAASTFTPRRIGQVAAKSTTPAATTSTLSSSQLLANKRAERAAAEAAAATPAATAAVDPNWAQVMKNQQQAAAMWNAVQGSESMNHDRSGQMMNRTPQKQYGAYTRAMNTAGNEAKANGTDVWMAKQMVDPSKYGGNYMTHHNKGGVIPEPGQAFARGGKVRDLKERTRMDSAWDQMEDVESGDSEEGEEITPEEMMKLRTRMPGQLYRENFARGGSVDPNRSRARQGGAVYEASRDHEYWQQRSPRPQSQHAESAGYAPTSVAGARGPKRQSPDTRQGGEPERAAPGKKGGAEKKESKPAKSSEKKPDSKQPEKKTAEGEPRIQEDRETRFRRPRAGLDQNPYDTGRGTGTPPLEETAIPLPPGDLGGVPPDLVRPDPGTRAAVPGSEGAAEVIETIKKDPRIQPKATSGNTGLMELLEPLAADPATGKPKFLTPGPPAEPVIEEDRDSRQGPVMERPYLAPIDNTLPPGSFPAPTPERFGPPADAATPAPAYLHGDPVYAPGVSPPPEPEPGAWIGGQFVPLSSLQGNGYARGGVIADPDDEEEPISPRAESANYTTSAPASAATRGRPAPSDTPTEESAPAPAAEERPARADVQPTPKLMADVDTALKGGANYLKRVFGLDGAEAGAVPTPEDGAARQQGIKRFASGEGAATPDEIKEIDDQIDPRRELSEGDRQMTRMAKITQFYLERGQKDEAEAAAASLMQYGARRFGQLGQLAQAAYSQYERTGDQSHLEKATQILSQAYGMIPDGGSMSVTTDPETGEFQATRLNADGEEEVYNIKANELPGLIQQTMSGSAYWQQIMRLGDPEGAKSRDTDRRELLKQDRTDQRAEEKRIAAQEEWNRQHAITREEKVGDTEKAAEAKTKESDRVAQRNYDMAMKKWKEQHPDKEEAFNKIKGPFAIADKMREEFTAQMAEDSDYAETEEGQAARAAYSEKATELYNALPMPAQDRMNWMVENGFDPDGWDYVGDQEEGAPAEAEPAVAAEPDPNNPPEPGAELKKDKATGKPRWAIKKNGVWNWID